MKYLKRFEEDLFQKRSYDIGDYIKLDLDAIKETNKKNDWIGETPPNGEDIALIVKLTPNDKSKLYYTIEFYDGCFEDFYKVGDSDILRKATKEEIKEFEAKKLSDKYNL